MKLYYYPKSKKHTSTNTDVLILTSVGAFCKEFSLSDYQGRVLRTCLGKPYLENNFLHVGVTHTDNIVIGAVDFSPLGIDCESKTRVMKTKERIMNRFFTDNEREWIKSNSDTDTAFLHMWVKKEAYVKFTGEGISGLCSCDVTTMENSFTLQKNDKNLIIYTYKEKNNE